MDAGKPNSLQFLLNNIVYSETDVSRFLPTYEYIHSNKTKSCSFCRSVVYSNNSDISPLSIKEIVHYYYNNILKAKNESIEDVKVNSFFGRLGNQSSINAKDTRKVGDSYSDNQIATKFQLAKEKLKISDSLLALPIFHRCNSCFKAWNIHLEIKRRILTSATIKPYDFSVDLTSSLILPISNKFFQGMIYTNVENEKEIVTNHISEIKKIFSSNKSNSLLVAKNKLAYNNIEGCMKELTMLLSNENDNLFSNMLLQIQSRSARLKQDKIKGILSINEENLFENRISKDLIELIEEIERYLNF